MKIHIDITLDEIRPGAKFDVELEYQPSDLKLTVEKKTMLRGLMIIILDKIPCTELQQQ
jgi:hypothetical protein